MSEAADQMPEVDPAAGGQVDGGEQAAEAEPEVWSDWESYGDRHVPITVDGQQQSVPLRELTQGYQRQADYTQKTQALSERSRSLTQAEAIYNALQSDPVRTMELLKEAYEVNSAGEEAEPEFLSEEEKRLS